MLKKFFNTLLILMAIAYITPAFSANSFTDEVSIEYSMCGTRTLYQKDVAFDTINTDFTVFTPSSGKHAILVGLVFSETDAFNLTMTNGSTAMGALEVSAGNGALMGAGTKPIFFTDKGSALKAKVSVAGNIRFFVVESDRFCDQSAW
jgi:hypothetical protein